MRIQKFLRDKGVGALRKCDEFVQNNKVFVNNERLNNPTYYLKAGDVVRVGKKTYTFTSSFPQANEPHVYYKFNKPKNVLSAHADERGREVLFDYINKKALGIYQRPLFYAGRLDYETRGLMLLSTDGNFIQAISHPSNGFTKEYLVHLSSPLKQKQIDYLEKISQGFDREIATYRAFRYIVETPKKLIIYLTEGQKREVRYIVDTIGAHVSDLIRMTIYHPDKGNYALGKLGVGSLKPFIPHKNLLISLQKIPKKSNLS